MRHTVPMRDWLVAGGLLRGADGVLLVQNERRNGSLDWSTPGGVIDEGETLLEGLTREVHEETGLTVASWDHCAYEIEVDFVEREMFLRVEAHVATSWDGALVVDDPDGIVVDAGFMDDVEAHARIAEAPRWVAEPFTTWLTTGVCVDPFKYVVRGDLAGGFTVDRL